MKVIAITELRIGSAPALQHYADTAGPLIDKVGGRLTGRYEVTETLAGSANTQFITVVEYPDRNAVAGVFESNEYLGLKDVIRSAFARYDVHIVAERVVDRE